MTLAFSLSEEKIQWRILKLGIDMTVKQFKGHVRSHFINYMTRPTSKLSNRRWSRLNLPQCSLKLFRIFIHHCAVARCLVSGSILSRGSALIEVLLGFTVAHQSLPTLASIASLLRITYFQLTLRKKIFCERYFHEQISMSRFTTGSVNMWFGCASISQTIT